MNEPDGPDVESAFDLDPDPVTEADAYREMLLGLLGERDPAEVQAELPAQLEEVLKEAGPDLRARPAQGEWSVLELMGHLLDAEMVLAARYRWIVAQDRPELIGYDQDLWVGRLRHQEDDPHEMLALFTALRRANLDLWARTPSDQRDRVGLHAERGPESFDLSFRMLAGHDIFHVAQMRRTLALVRTSD